MKPGSSDIKKYCGEIRCGTRHFSRVPKMRIFNPKRAEKSWDAANTVIEFTNDDMPFLMDSIAMEINRQGIASQPLLHPTFHRSREQHGVLTTLDEARAGTHAQSWIHVAVERITDPLRVKALGDGLVSVLNDVRAAVEYFPLMKAKIAEMLANMRSAAKVPGAHAARAWLQFSLDTLCIAFVVHIVAANFWGRRDNGYCARYICARKYSND